MHFELLSRQCQISMIQFAVQCMSYYCSWAWLFWIVVTLCFVIPLQNQIFLCLFGCLCMLHHPGETQHWHQHSQHMVQRVLQHRARLEKEGIRVSYERERVTRHSRLFVHMRSGNCIPAQRMCTIFVIGGPLS